MSSGGRDVVPLAGVTIDLDPLGAWFVFVAGCRDRRGVGVRDRVLRSCAERSGGAVHVSAVRGDAGAGSRGGEHVDVPRVVGADGDDVAGARRGRASRPARGTAGDGLVRRDDPARVRRDSARVRSARGGCGWRDVRGDAARRARGCRRLARRPCSCWRWSVSVRRRGWSRCTCGCRVRIRRRRAMCRR